MGVFDENADLYEAYEATLAFRNAIRGGIPFDPKMVEKWLLHSSGVEKDEERKRMLVQTLNELDPDLDLDADMDMDVIFEAAEVVAEEVQTQGFKRDDRAGLYVESRQVKAMLKENVNAHYAHTAGDRWGPTNKGPRGFVAEHVFVEPDRIYLGRTEPDRVDQTITHTRHGAAIGYVEAVEEPRLKMVFRFDREAVEELLEAEDGERWATIMASAQNNGLGADRSQGFGKFEVVGWEELETYDREAWQDARVAELAGRGEEAVA